MDISVSIYLYTAGGDQGVHLRRPRPDRERLITPAIARCCAAVQRVAAGAPARHRPDRPMCTQCARVRRGVQCLELQRFREEALELEGLQLVVAQVAVQRAGAARDRRRRRRRAGVWGAQDSQPIGYQVTVILGIVCGERVEAGDGVVRRLAAQ
jgi:hypothetical protein